MDDMYIFIRTIKIQYHETLACIRMCLDGRRLVVF